MNDASIENIISLERLNPYLKRHDNDFAKAIHHYKANILISEAFYPLMAIIEIGLRNNVNEQLTRRFNTKCWYENPEFIKLVSSYQISRIEDARKSILINKKEITSGRIISELTFGFWTSLFDSKYDKSLWKNLRFSFPNCPKHIIQRKTISGKFNGIRKFRNRLFHHEPISWNYQAVHNYRDEILNGIDWLHHDLLKWSSDIFRIDEVLEKEMFNLS